MLRISDMAARAAFGSPRNTTTPRPAVEFAICPHAPFCPHRWIGSICAPTRQVGSYGISLLQANRLHENQCLGG